MPELFKKITGLKIHQTISRLRCFASTIFRQLRDRDQFDYDISPRCACEISDSLACILADLQTCRLADLQNRRIADLKILLVFICLQFLFQIKVNSQVYERPNFSFSSHETLDLERVEVDANQTKVYMSILNRKLGGSFCVDTSTYIKNSLGSDEYKLIQSVGVPDCPDVHKFNIVGKKLSFILIFPSINKDIRYIDLIENCTEACLSIRYILLDTVINERINKALKIYESRKLEESLAIFEEIMLSYNDNKSPVFGTVYLYMMNINYELGQSKEIRRLYDELKQSSIINKEEIIEEARYQEIVR